MGGAAICFCATTVTATNKGAFLYHETRLRVFVCVCVCVHARVCGDRQPRARRRKIFFIAQRASEVRKGLPVGGDCPARAADGDKKNSVTRYGVVAATAAAAAAAADLVGGIGDTTGIAATGSPAQMRRRASTPTLASKSCALHPARNVVMA